MQQLNLTLPIKGLSQLKQLKGKTLTDIYASVPNDNDRLFYAPFILKLDDETFFTISADEIGTEYYGTHEEFAYLCCKSLEEPPQIKSLFHKKIQPLRVQSIEIITDEITETEPESGDFSFRVDAAIILHDNHGFMTFSLPADELWFATCTRSENKTIDQLRPVSTIKESLSEGLDGSNVQVSRTSRFL